MSNANEQAFKNGMAIDDDDDTTVIYVSYYSIWRDTFSTQVTFAEKWNSVFVAPKYGTKELTMYLKNLKLNCACLSTKITFV